MLWLRVFGSVPQTFRGMPDAQHCLEPQGTRPGSLRRLAPRLRDRREETGFRRRRERDPDSLDLERAHQGQTEKAAGQAALAKGTPSRSARRVEVAKRACAMRSAKSVSTAPTGERPSRIAPSKSS